MKTDTATIIWTKIDEAPALALRGKKDSSMRVAIDLVKSGEADACVSAGNTGALMATARFVLKTLPGIDRPAIAAVMPTVKGHALQMLIGKEPEALKRLRQGVTMTPPQPADMNQWVEMAETGAATASAAAGTATATATIAMTVRSAMIGPIGKTVQAETSAGHRSRVRRMRRRAAKHLPGRPMVPRVSSVGATASRRHRRTSSRSFCAGRCAVRGARATELRARRTELSRTTAIATEPFGSVRSGRAP